MLKIDWKRFVGGGRQEQEPTHKEEAGSNLDAVEQNLIAFQSIIRRMLNSEEFIHLNGETSLKRAENGSDSCELTIQVKGHAPHILQVQNDGFASCMRERIDHEKTTAHAKHAFQAGMYNDVRTQFLIGVCKDMKPDSPNDLFHKIAIQAAQFQPGDTPVSQDDVHQYMKAYANAILRSMLKSLEGFHNSVRCKVIKNEKPGQEQCSLQIILDEKAALCLDVYKEGDAVLKSHSYDPDTDTLTLDHMQQLGHYDSAAEGQEAMIRHFGDYLDPRQSENITMVITDRAKRALRVSIAAEEKTPTAQPPKPGQ